MSERTDQVLCASEDLEDDPPCDACGDAHFEVELVETPIYDDQDRQIVVTVSLCSTCYEIDQLAMRAAENVLIRMGAITREVDTSEAN